MKARPLKNRIVLEPIAAPNVSPGGIVIVGSEKKAALEGLVLACGPDVREVHDGDRVLYDKFAGTQLPGGVHVLNEDDVLAVLG